MADQCGIKWTETVVHIQENASVSLTASASTGWAADLWEILGQVAILSRST
jgi:hypothetical protein